MSVEIINIQGFADDDAMSTSAGSASTLPLPGTGAVDSGDLETPGASPGNPSVHPNAGQTSTDLYEYEWADVYHEEDLRGIGTGTGTGTGTRTLPAGPDHHRCWGRGRFLMWCALVLLPHRSQTEIELLCRKLLDEGIHAPEDFYLQHLTDQVLEDRLTTKPAWNLGQISDVISLSRSLEWESQLLH